MSMAENKRNKYPVLNPLVVIFPFPPSTQLCLFGSICLLSLRLLQLTSQS